MNKGFTLIELIGTIVILSLIVLIITPIITSSLKQGVADSDKRAKESIEMAARNWASDNLDKLPDNSCSISVSILQAEGYIDDNLKMPSTGADLSEKCIIITKKESEKKSFRYEYSDSCGEFCQ